MSRHYEIYFPGEQEPPRIISTSMEHRRLSDLARVTLQLDTCSTEIYVKFHKHPHSPDERVRAKAQLEYETLQWLSEAFTSVPGCAVVCPIAYFSEYKAVVTKKAEGTSLYAWLNRPLHRLLGIDRTRVEGWCCQAGGWLRKFQELTAKGEQERFESGRFWGEIESILQRCDRLGFSRPFRERIGAWLKSELDRLGEPEVEVVGQHPDFHPQNILVASKGITVLDFTSFRHGNRYHDVASFLTFLDSRLKHPFFRPAQIDHLRANFLRGYRLLALEDPFLQLCCVKEMLNYCATLLSRMPGASWSLGMVQRFFHRWAEQRAIPMPEPLA
jgi:thiamine kinase-like enzyme